MRSWPVLLLLGLAGCGGAFASSVFEVDDEGWVLANNGAGTNASEVILDRSHGNPGGCICGVDQADGDIWYFAAPAKFQGDASAYYGKRLTFDMKQFSIFNQIHGRDVVLSGGGLAVVNTMHFNPGLDWTSYSFTLDDTSGWTVDQPTGQGPVATEAQLRTVLKGLTSLRIRGEFFDGLPDKACLDNVILGQE